MGLAWSSQQKKQNLIALGAVPPLVALLSSQQPAVQEQAAGVLRKLAWSNQQNMGFVIAAGALPPLVA